MEHNCSTCSLTVLFLSLTRMIEDCGQRGDNMADRRQLFVEMSKCSRTRRRVIYTELFYTLAIKMANISCNFH